MRATRALAHRASAKPGVGKEGSSLCFCFSLALLDLAQSEKAMAGMNGRPVYCIGCGMWEFLETTCLPEVHICARCVELQLLREHARELELRLDDLSLVRQNERFIDRSYRQVVTPGSRKDDVEMPALDWGKHSKGFNNTRFKSNRFIW